MGLMEKTLLAKVRKIAMDAGVTAEEWDQILEQARKEALTADPGELLDLLARMQAQVEAQ
jgi:hypothetical protein